MIAGFCPRCAGTHGNNPCPAGTPQNNNPQPFFQFNNVQSASAQSPEASRVPTNTDINTWTCVDCSTVNLSNESPIKCRICRRYR